MSSSMKDSRPVRMDATLHMGFHVSGWKSDMERHSRRLVSKRPFGVSIIIAGGLKGYSGCNIGGEWGYDHVDQDLESAVVTPPNRQA